MRATSSELVARIRELRARDLSPDAYARELSVLAGWEFGDSNSAEQVHTTGLSRLFWLRKRIAALERKVAELEVVK